MTPMQQMWHRRIIIGGFCAAYCASMAALAVLSTPLLEGKRFEIFSFLLLPVLLVGLACIAIGKWMER
ncbi:MAG: hypothetical protein K2Y71_12675 [Xanthobacteraceae bacterium]|nr:hypothetical protein [Xanthobacteraceae bacterium]